MITTAVLQPDFKRSATLAVCLTHLRVIHLTQSVGRSRLERCDIREHVSCIATVSALCKDRCRVSIGTRWNYTWLAHLGSSLCCPALPSVVTPWATTGVASDDLTAGQSRWHARCRHGVHSAVSTVSCYCGREVCTTFRLLSHTRSTLVRTVMPNVAGHLLSSRSASSSRTGGDLILAQYLSAEIVLCNAVLRIQPRSSRNRLWTWRSDRWVTCRA